MPKKNFDIIDVLVWMAISIALCLFFVYPYLEELKEAKEEPFVFAYERAKELTNSNFGYGNFYYYNNSDNINKMIYGDITPESLKEN